MNRTWPLAPTWPLLVVLGATSRVLVLALGCMLARVPLPAVFQDNTNITVNNQGYNLRHIAALSDGRHRWVEPWYRFDAIWFAEVSEKGYDYELGRECSVPFFPLLPLLMSAAAELGFDRYWAGLLIANAAFVVGLVLFGRLALRLTGDNGSVWRAILLLVAYPASMFFSAPYAESLALAFSTAAVLGWLDRRVASSAACLALSTAARITSVSLCIGIVLEWFGRVVTRRPRQRGAWLVASCGAAGIGVFFLAMALKFGDPFVSLKAHAAWQRSPSQLANLFGFLQFLAHQMARSLILASMVTAVLIWLLQEPLTLGWKRFAAARAPSPPRGGPRPAPDGDHGPVGEWTRGSDVMLGTLLGCACIVGAITWRIDLRSVADRAMLIPMVFRFYSNELIAIAFIGLGIRAWGKRGPLWGCWILVPILQGLSTGSDMSMNRLALAAYPAFIEAAQLLRSRILFAACLGIFLLAQYVMIDRFVNWSFIG
jgi:hypothetical protein